MGNYVKKMEYITLICNKLNEAGIKFDIGGLQSGISQALVIVLK